MAKSAKELEQPPKPESQQPAAAPVQTLSDPPKEEPKEEPKDQAPMTQRTDGVIGRVKTEEEIIAEQETPSTSTTLFNPEDRTHEADADFCAVIDSFFPEERELWSHPENPKIVYAFGLPQARVQDDFNVRDATREVVLEWIYQKLWRRMGMSGSCKNVEAATVILKMLMQFPTKKCAFMAQRVIVAFAGKEVSSPGSTAIDGVWGERTRSEIYAALCKRFDATRLALYAECYSELQSFKAGDEAMWAPVLEAYVSRRI
ncbi:MAG: hypothetical protein IIB38_15320 [Candidatus Hydrogenedentes bacterium]|nr:hypothetical protein [Candidatus Hydrogenedentota bacterium]